MEKQVNPRSKAEPPPIRQQHSEEQGVHAEVRRIKDLFGANWRRWKHPVADDPDREAAPGGAEKQKRDGAERIFQGISFPSQQQPHQAGKEKIEMLFDRQ